MLYHHLPTTVNAIRFDGDEATLDSIERFIFDAGTVILLKDCDCHPGYEYAIARNDGNVYPFKNNDWIIRQDSGCIYTCTEESFRRNYQ